MLRGRNRKKDLEKDCGIDSITGRENMYNVLALNFSVVGPEGPIRFKRHSAKMFFRIPLLTPGYIRYLQTQAARTGHQKEGPFIPRFAMLLGLVGIGMSGYSSRQLTLHHKPSEHLLR